MTLDVRRPLGWLFLCLGLVLTAYGWLGHRLGQSHPHPNDYRNLRWGLFGCAILWISRRRPGR